MLLRESLITAEGAEVFSADQPSLVSGEGVLPAGGICHTLEATLAAQDKKLEAEELLRHAQEAIQKAEAMENHLCAKLGFALEALQQAFWVSRPQKALVDVDAVAKAPGVAKAREAGGLEDVGEVLQR
ncbi:hypothetical protein CYMTET_48405 [Cymbomonas tetramitiformis]|uniref:Uncharacterized protein n=1 Tax=Cymbomonas tetramitiformis TaxID=36881 RepID=A0AAE0BTJ5_9CHLO|nr:hypothetical protein CYMTET_48405 [Cymbomonas tetramitiformis]